MSTTRHLAEFVPSLPATVFWRRWFGPASAPGKVQWDGNLATLSATAPNVATVTLATGESFIEDGAWASDVSRAYFACRTNVAPYYLIRFDPATNTYTAYTSTSDYRYAMALCVSGGKVFVAHFKAGSSNCFISVFSTALPLSDPSAYLGTYEYGNSPSESIATD